MNKMPVLVAVLAILLVPVSNAEIDKFNGAKTNSLGQTYHIYLPGHMEINSTVVGPFFYYDTHILHVASNTTVKAKFGCKDDAYYPISIVSGGKRGDLFCPDIINFSKPLQAGTYRITVGWMGGDWGNIDYYAKYDG